MSSRASTSSVVDSVADDMEVASGRVGKRARVNGLLGDAVDSEQVSKAKKRVITAMSKDDRLTLRIDYLITAGKLSAKQKGDGAAAMLPSCSNKYHLIDKERIVELLMSLRGDLPKQPLMKMDLDQLQKLLRFGLRLSDKCAVPTRVWQQLLDEAVSRYETLGGNRLDKVVLSKAGGGKHVYFEVDYSVCGAYMLVQKGRRFTHIKHVSGCQVKLQQPLDVSYRVEKNDDDMRAVLTSESHAAEIPVAKLFEKAGLASNLPQELDLQRIGQPSPSKVPETPQARMMAIEDGTVDGEWEAKPVGAKGAGASKSSSIGDKATGGVRHSTKRPPSRKQ